MNEEAPMIISMIKPTSDPLKEDVVGVARTFIDDFLENKNAEGIYSSMGVQPDKIFGLFGVPGTGKTLSVQALLNESWRSEILRATKDSKMSDFDANKVICGFRYDIGTFGSKYINENSTRIQTFFNTVINVASDYKVLIELDEADALLGSRTGDVRSHSEDRKVLETLMKNLQICHDTPNVYVALMSNLPEACDDASLRAGRIDKKYVFKLPTLEERVAGFECAIDKVNKQAGYQVARNYNSDELAEASDGFSYADIVQSVRGAVKVRASEVARDRTSKVIPASYVTNKRLKTAVAEHAKQFKKEKKAGIGF